MNSSRRGKPDEVNPTHKYDLFVSHSTRLDPDIEELVDGLVDCLTRRGLKVFLDRRWFGGGEPLIESIEEAIAHSRLGLVILTGMASASQWVRLEIGAMIKERAGRGMKILTLQIGSDGEMPSGIKPDRIIVAPPTHNPGILCEKVERIVRTVLTSS